MKKKIMFLLIVTLLMSQISVVMATDSEELFETLVLYHPDYNIDTVYDGNINEGGNVHYFNDPILRGDHVYFYSPIKRTKQSSEIYFRSFNLNTNNVETMGVPELGTHTVGHTDEVSNEHRYIAFDYDEDSNSLMYIIRNASSPFRYLSAKIYQVDTEVSSSGNRVFQNFGDNARKIGSTDAIRSHLFGTRYSDMLITDQGIYFNTNDPSNSSIYAFNRHDGSNRIEHAFKPEDESYFRLPGQRMSPFPFFIDEDESIRYKMDFVERTIPTPFARTFRQNFNGQHSIGGGVPYIEYAEPRQKSRFARLIAYNHETGDRWVAKEFDDFYIPVTIHDGLFYCTGPTEYEISRVDPITREVETIYDMRNDSNAYPDVVWTGAMPSPQPLGEYNGDLIFMLPSSVATPPRLMRAPIN